MICPVCQTTTKYYFSCKDHLVSGKLFSIQKCPFCGFAFTENPPSPDEIGAYYQAEEYLSHATSRKGLIPLLYHLARKEMIRYKRKLIEKQSGLTKGQLLDIGCGTGQFLHSLQEKGWQVLGIEPDPGAREYASRHFSLQVKNRQSLEELPEEGKKFDVITLWHSLEHIHDLKGTVQQIKKLLRPQGLLVVALPNRTSYDASLYGKDWAAWDVPRHLWHFSEYSAQKFFQDQGLVIKKIQSMPLDAFYISLLTHRNKKEPLALLKGIRTGIYGWWLSREKMEASSSLIYFMTARK